MKRKMAKHAEIVELVLDRLPRIDLPPGADADQVISILAPIVANVTTSTDVAGQRPVPAHFDQLGAVVATLAHLVADQSMLLADAVQLVRRAEIMMADGEVVVKLPETPGRTVN